MHSLQIDDQKGGKGRASKPKPLFHVALPKTSTSTDRTEPHPLQIDYQDRGEPLEPKTPPSVALPKTEHQRTGQNCILCRLIIRTGGSLRNPKRRSMSRFPKPPLPSSMSFSSFSVSSPTAFLSPLSPAFLMSFSRSFLSPLPPQSVRKCSENTVWMRLRRVLNQ